MKIKRAVFLHSLNDFSGAPQVLSEVVRTAVRTGWCCHLVTSGGPGFLDNLPGCSSIRFPLRQPRGTPRWGRLWFLAFNIWSLVILIRLRLAGDRVYYSNTIVHTLPNIVGALLFRRRVVHIHEVQMRPRALYLLNLKVVETCFCKHLVVSRYLATHKDYRKLTPLVVPNASRFPVECPDLDRVYRRFTTRRVLFVGNDLPQKNFGAFIDLAGRLPEFDFCALLGSRKKPRAVYPNNLKVLENMSSIAPLYRESSLYINLTLPNLWIETFSLTTVEALSFGLPVIGPNRGGITELIADGANGFKVDVSSLSELEIAVRRIFTNLETYSRFVNHSVELARGFQATRFSAEISTIMESL